MVHLRLVVPLTAVAAVLEILARCASVINVVHLPGVATKPSGDLVMCDVAREDASVVIADLTALGLEENGSIALENVDTSISHASVAAERAAPGSPSDAVLWEDVTARTSESATISWVFLIFMVLASLIAAVGIVLDSPILVVGAMVVGPEFGPVAGVCVALVQRAPRLATRSLAALAAGFPLGIALTVLMTVIFKATDVIPDDFDPAAHSLSSAIAQPDFLAFFVAFSAGIAGMLSLSTAKSGALIGVLISVTTIPASANAAVAAGYGDWSTFEGSLGQLGINLTAMLAAGTLTLGIQRWLYARRRAGYRARHGGAG
ncbi:hypothetical protein DSM112329_02398 [Paraconexibacter sp. AEG42_29]|uniref:DUF389 domain-containing protein n=1 Tax=Paraconexibacter sp. AEG42_29 TaxID=2997339 RepID=A0AAU7AV74_9ACTN